MSAERSLATPFVSYLNLDLDGCKSQKIRDRDNILNFSKQACDLLETDPRESPNAIRFGLGSHAEGFSLVLITKTRDVLIGHFAELTNSAYVDWSWMANRANPITQTHVEGMRLLSKKAFGAETLTVSTERYCDNPKVAAQDTNKYGLALFAEEDIQAGEIIAFFEGQVYKVNKATDLPNDPPEYALDHALQFERHRWRGSSGLAKLTSHSCEPNCGIKDRFKIVAMRRIKKGEEISIDYEMSEDSDWQMECQCGSPGCRGLIRGFRFLPAEQRQKYQGYISGYLVLQEHEAFENEGCDSKRKFEFIFPPQSGILPLAR